MASITLCGFCGGRVIEPSQRLAMNLLIEHRKVAADDVDVEGRDDSVGSELPLSAR